MVKNKDEVTYLLGQYDYTDTTNSGKIQTINYFVMDYYGIDIDPQFSITLKLEIDTTQLTVKKAWKFETVDGRSIIEKLFFH